MIALFTDFGADDIYVGQLKASLLEHLPAEISIVDLLHSVSGFHVRGAAHLLDALQRRFPAGAVFLAVVDPGVGTARDAVILQADNKWYVGPDNGLLSVISARAAESQTWRIFWRPQGLSASFHARDLFAPIAAAIAAGEFPVAQVEVIGELDVRFGPEDLAEMVYIDHYGNAVTGLRGVTLPRTAILAVQGRQVRYARVFADVPEGEIFWYENSVGLVGIAANRASAATQLRLHVGDPLQIVASSGKSA
jgi:S-adenosylmethionine hydrolase